MADIIARYDNPEGRAQIGERIKALRKEKGFTQKQLAGYISDVVHVDSDTGFGQSTVSGWETGNQLPPLPKLIALSEIFRCDIGYLLCDYDTKRKTVADIAEFTGLSETAVDFLESLKQEKTIKCEYALKAIDLLLADCNVDFWKRIFLYLTNDGTPYGASVKGETELKIFDGEEILGLYLSENNAYLKQLRNKWQEYHRNI